MSNGSAQGGFEPPSGKHLAIGTGIALIVALIVLVAVIWPAEYGRDPTGVGGLLGITGMSSGRQATRTIEIVDVIGGNERLREVEIPAFDEPVPLPNPNVARHEETAPETRTKIVELPFGGETEVKLVLGEGQMVVYEWHTDEGLVYSQFHGHTPEFGEKFWVEYEEYEQGAASSSGSLVAPFSGEHGWYWVNLNDGPVTVTLTATGYFDDIVDYSELF